MATAGGGDLRIGVFVCQCGLNIQGTVDCADVAEFAEGLDDVVAVYNNKYTCSEPGQLEIKKSIIENSLNRVVIASCSPRMHEPTFRAALEGAGLNPYLLEMANLREHCSWVHIHEREAATEKAKDLVKMAVARARGISGRRKRWSSRSRRRRWWWVVVSRGSRRRWTWPTLATRSFWSRRNRPSVG